MVNWSYGRIIQINAYALLPFLKNMLDAPDLCGAVPVCLLATKKPHDSVTTDTVGRWQRKVLENSGLDVRKYGAHSTRTASTSAAKTVNISIQSIMDAAGWSNAETFRKFYDKPLDTEAGSFGTELLHAIDA